MCVKSTHSNSITFLFIFISKNAISLSSSSKPADIFLKESKDWHCEAHRSLYVADGCVSWNQLDFCCSCLPPLGFLCLQAQLHSCKVWHQAFSTKQWNRILEHSVYLRSGYVLVVAFICLFCVYLHVLLIWSEAQTSVQTFIFALALINPSLYVFVKRKYQVLSTKLFLL